MCLGILLERLTALSSAQKDLTRLALSLAASLVLPAPARSFCRPRRGCLAELGLPGSRGVSGKAKAFPAEGTDGLAPPPAPLPARNADVQLPKWPLQRPTGGNEQ